MSLVKTEDFHGSEIANAAMEALEMIGLINKLNINGYHLSIDGIQGDTPKGMMEDLPSKHIVSIERNKYIGTMTKKEFKGLNKDTVVTEQDQFNLNFDDTENCKVIHDISREPSGYVFYKHKVDMRIDKPLVETDENYMKRVFETVANYVISTLEKMEEAN